jgi:PAS domain S-box-containing protein
MTSRQQRVQTLYEISLAIESRSTLEQTTDRALAAYMRKLNCSVGAIVRAVTADDRVELSVTSAIPANPERTELFRAARDRLTSTLRTGTASSVSVSLDRTAETRFPRAPNSPRGSGESGALADSLPVSGTVDRTSHYYLMELPGFGVLLLGNRDGSLDTETVSALTPLNEKLADACRSNLTETRLREQRDRFEAVFEAIPEPVVHAAVGDTVRLIDTNEAFDETFGHGDQAIQKQRRGSLVVPGVGSADEDRVVETLDRGEVYTCELERESDSGTEHFLFNGVPVADTGVIEYFGVYIDITDQKAREQTLEELYVAAQDLLSEESRRRVCQRTVEAVESILDYSRVGVYLYNRDAETLDPVATGDYPCDGHDGGPSPLTERDTPAWEAYRDSRTIRIDDPGAFSGTLPAEGAPAGGAVILPIGVHGVLYTSASRPNAVEDEDVYFLRLLSQLVEIALTRTVNENGLRAVQETVRTALDADTHEEMASTVLEKIPSELDLPLAGLWKHNPAQQTLEPLDQTDEADDLFSDQPTFQDGESIAWQAFETQSTRIISDASQHTDRYNAETPIEGEITVPLGEFGILTAASTREDTFTELDAEILEVLAANLEVLARVIDNRQDVRLLDQVIARILRHNVRNQLTPIRGYADTISREADGQAETYARRIVESCEDLEKTAEHAREMRQVVRNRSRTTRLSLGSEVRTAASAVEEEFPEGTLVVRVEDTPEVTAHPELAVAIRHLLRNGFEHNHHENPRVRISVEERPPGPTVEVTDDGPGIDTHELDVIDKHDESALKHGSGAGLWIVDRVIEYSDALLEFERSDGTTATITFPSDPTSHDTSSGSG